MSYETIVYEKKQRLAYITLNRPRLLNAYNDTMADELLQAHRDFDQDDALHVLIISGAGRAFCSGKVPHSYAGGMRVAAQCRRRGEMTPCYSHSQVSLVFMPPCIEGAFIPRRRRNF